MDLMEHNENRGTQEFIDMMLNVGLHTVISKPIQNKIINKFFDGQYIDNTNCINDDIYSGLLINDLSDHLPIFIANERNMNHNNSD